MTKYHSLWHSNTFYSQLNADSDNLLHSSAVSTL